MKKSTVRIVSMVMFLIGILMLCAPILIDNAEKVVYIGAPITCVGIVVFASTFEFGFRRKKTYHVTAPQVAQNNTSEDQAFIDGYRSCDLQYFDNCVKLFYSKDGKKRLVFCRSNNAIVARLQEIKIHKSAITNNPIFCAFWVTASGKDSFFASLEIALKEYEKELSIGYVEENIDKTYKNVWNRHAEYYAEIDWIKEENGGRKTIPYGYKYWPQIIIEGSNKELPEYSVVLRNIEGLAKYKTLAIIRYAFEGAPNDLREEMKFAICEGNRKVATGVIKSKRENIDI